MSKLRTGKHRNKIKQCLLTGICMLAAGNIHADQTSAKSEHGQAFHVSNAGNDAWDGTAPEHRGGTTGPWKSLAKVNERMEAIEGGRVLFRRGDRFEGHLKVRGRNIVFAAYGEGARPVLSGSRPLDGEWKPVAGRPKVYSTELPVDVGEVTVLTHNGVSLPLGRSPNSTDPEKPAFHMFESRTVDSITGPDLAGAGELAGAELVLRKNNWTYHAYTVSSVSGNTARFPNEEPPSRKKGDQNLQNAGYFFQKHLATLDRDGEWFFDPAKHLLFLYSEQPPEREAFHYSAEQVVVVISGADGISLEGIGIEMAASLGIEIENSSAVMIRDCEIRFCGREGIRLNASSATIDGNTLHDCLGCGIHAIGKGRVVVTRNTISNIGLIPGRGWTAGPHAARRNGIMLMGGNSEASYNRITDIGYIGIQHVEGNNLVRRNVIERYNRVAFDGGAIYTYNNQAGSVVEENIIRHGMANDSGLAGGKFFSTGIQCDAKTENLVIRNNTIAYPKASVGAGAIHLNFNGRNNTVSGNTILTRSTGISTLDRDPFTRKPGQRHPPSMSGNVFEENVIVRLTAAQPAKPFRWATILLQDTQQCDMGRQGVFRGNVCAVPFVGAQPIFESQTNCTDPKAEKFNIWFASAARWNRIRPYASDNLDAPLRIAGTEAPDGFVSLFANDSDTPREFTLPEGAYVDPRGKSYSRSVTVAPWRSVILFRVPEK